MVAMYDNQGSDDDVKITMSTANDGNSASAPDSGVLGDTTAGGTDGFAPTPQTAEWDGAKIIPKTLHNSDVSGARENVPDIQVVGDGDTFKLICKASSEREGWMKSTKAMSVGHGCVVQVTTQQRGLDGTYAVAEAVCYVPGVKIRMKDGVHILTKA
jgi:hypothetical protein